jgi:hypothetical protein
MGSAVIGALRVNLSADTAEFQRNLTDAERIAQRFGTVVGSEIRKHLLALGAAAAAAAGPTALGLLVKSSFETISAQVDLARRVGASVVAIQTLEQAAKLSGGSAEDLAAALGRLNVSLGQAAREGAGPAYEALQRLGLSAQALSNMDADKRIEALSDRMKELGYNTQQQADTLKALGIKQQDLINLFQQGSTAIERARDDLKDWGVLLSDIDAAKVEEANNAWQRIGAVLEGVGNQIAIRVAPFVEALADEIGDAAKDTHGFGDVMDQVMSTGIHWWAELNVEVNDFERSVYMAGDGLADLINTLAKAPAGLLVKIFGQDFHPEDFADAVSNPFKQWLADLKDPKTEAEILAQIKAIRQKAEDAARNAVDASKPGGTSDDDPETEAQAKELEKYQAHLTQKLDALRQSVGTQRDIEDASYEQRLSDLEDFHAAGLVSDQEYTDLLVQNYKGHADKLKKIDDEVARNNKRNADLQRRAIFDVADNIASTLESIFGKNKLVAIAQAVINTAQAVTKSLAEYGATPWGLAAAATAAVAGAAQIAVIANTTSSGGGGRGSSVASSVPSSTASQPAQPAPAVPTQTFFISGIHPGQIFTGEALRGLMEQLVDAQRDGAKLVLGPA